VVAMPYILVNIVLGKLSLILFCITSAALLAQYPPANRYLPAQLRTRRSLAFVAQAAVLAVLAIAVVYGWRRIRNGFVYSSHLFDLFWLIAIVNAVVLTYQFLDGRFLLNRPGVQRRLVIAMVSVVTVSTAVLAVVAGVVRLFVIR
jgi:hypothetical protein